MFYPLLSAPCALLPRLGIGTRSLLSLGGESQIDSVEGQTGVGASLPSAGGGNEGCVK